MDPEDVRLAVYRGFADDGRAPDADVIAARFGVPSSEVRDALRSLAAQRHLALDDADSVLMAHPFSAVPLGFAVMGARTLWWGGCAWDSFALPHLLDAPMLVSTTCPACGRAHAWTVDRDVPPDGDQVAHFLVPAARMWDDVVHTCGHQRIFCSSDCIERWLDDSGTAAGYELDLATLWRLAAHWYDGRLERGYRRRDPSDAAEYLRSVGLHGPFWGL